MNFMKKLIAFVVLIGLTVNVYAQSFPTLKNYVVNGVVFSDSSSYQEMLKRLGKPTRTEKIRNECAETIYTYYYYPSLTLIDRGAGINVAEIFFSYPKTQIHLSLITLDTNTTVSAIQKLGKLEVSAAKGITTYRLEDANDPSAWIFDFKGGRLHRVSFFSDDC